MSGCSFRGTNQSHNDHLVSEHIMLPLYPCQQPSCNERFFTSIECSEHQNAMHITRNPPIPSEDNQNRHSIVSTEALSRDAPVNHLHQVVDNMSLSIQQTLSPALNASDEPHPEELFRSDTVSQQISDTRVHLRDFAVANQPSTNVPPVPTSVGSASPALLDTEPNYSFEKTPQGKGSLTSAGLVPQGTDIRSRGSSEPLSSLFNDNALEIRQGSDQLPELYPQPIGDMSSIITSTKVNGLGDGPINQLKTTTDLTSLITVANDVMGQGGYSCVYLGDLNGQKVAVKALRVRLHESDKWERRLRREVRVLSALNHPNVTPLFGVATTSFSPLPAMITPWYTSGSADKYLSQHNPPVTKRINLCIDIANGLQYLHALSIVHGDLKPANVLIDDNENARLCDFGLASLLGEEAGTGFTTTTEYVGTARYAAPEIFNSPVEAVSYSPTPASDIFSFACLLYEITSRNPPYPMLKSSISLQAQILVRMITKLPPAAPSEDLDQLLSHHAPRIWGLLNRCWDFNPASRPLASDVVINLTDVH
ncbi:hypothetical protein M408DRAFT_330336 [Serendipita vermifera MAFF 305830]|uniref:Protein kinase domain-containing protein n=1 Tax=Serendipita vermifera MAFF 305830 TaxID=933852 RepID=A0A0C3B677_SERVB|nr:hypothetical protein M408DRAFT_330336 [Serendipita vermifera MAFF 305830]